MSWLKLPRTPEPEAMNDADEVEAYASAAAQTHLESVDNTLVEQVLSFGPLQGWLLDLGTGPGGIPLKLAQRSPQLRIVGVDRSAKMIRQARESAARQGLAGRAYFFVADANRLCFPGAWFDAVVSNSLLHHLRDPVGVFNEMARVAKPGALILARDLRRPLRPLFPLHVRWYGRHYSGLMKKLYIDSVRAAYTSEELADLLRRSQLPEARIFHHRRTHLGFLGSGPGPSEV